MKTGLTRGTIAALLLLAAAPAMAQMPAPGGAGPGGAGAGAAGGGNAALFQICREDLATYCAGVTPGNGAVRACIKENYRSFSPDCKAALMQAMMQRQQQGQ
ncbi:cysteine rich repeat-containing protein [Bosea sp. 117]|uniref:cysteine rich repeat-containing protein n=1 Tax=Bosea sp. 117 TaxID=1125973 RepID=UPI0006923F43|nr:cysteine rich repeat-containing protein [Bosea sp. 117]